MDNLRRFFSDRKNNLNVLFLALLIAGLPIGVNLVRQQQIFFSRAGGGQAVEFQEGACVSIRNGAKVFTCTQNISVVLTSKLGPTRSEATVNACSTPTPATNGGANNNNGNNDNPNTGQQGGPDNPPNPGANNPGADGGNGINGDGGANDSSTNTSNAPDDIASDVSTGNTGDNGAHDNGNSGDKGEKDQSSGPSGAEDSNPGDSAGDQGDQVFLPNILRPVQEFLSEHLPFTIKNAYAGDEEQTLAVNGTIFKDLNKNGIFDAGDQRFPGVPVRLVNDRGEAAGAMNSDASGNYSFDKLDSRFFYTVSIQTPTGYANKTPASVTRDLKVSPVINFGLLESTPPSPAVSSQPLNSPSVGASPTSQPSTPPGQVCGPSAHTLTYQIGENPTEARAAQAQPYSQHPSTINYSFKDSNGTQKCLYVLFKGKDINGNDVEDLQNSCLPLVGPDPLITNVDCTTSTTGSGIVLKINGTNFGAENGSLTANQKSTSIVNWQVSEVNSSTNSLTCDQKIDVLLTRKDGAQATGVYDPRAPLSLGAKLFCRRNVSYDQGNVDLVLLSSGQGQQKNKQKVVIDKDGLIKNIDGIFAKNKTYQLSVKAPGSIRRLSQPFKFQGGTANVIFRSPSSELGVQNFNVLPIGDIAPEANTDGKINAADKAVMNNQFNKISTSPLLGADLNQDTKVNSVDWACMRYDFNKTDDPEPSQVDEINDNPSSSPSPSPNPSPSTTSSSSTVKLSLTGPASVQNSQQFSVKVLLRSDSEAINAVDGSVVFDKDKLEFVNIDDSHSLATSWISKKLSSTSGNVVELIGGIPTPGVKTTGSDQEFATINFKAKATGTANFSFIDGAAVYSNSTNNNVINEKGVLSVTIN